MKDNYTGYVWLEATKEQDTDSVIKALERNIFAHHGLPDMITTDNHFVFNSTKMEELYKALNITKQNISRRKRSQKIIKSNPPQNQSISTNPN